MRPKYAISTGHGRAINFRVYCTRQSRKVDDKPKENPLKAIGMVMALGDMLSRDKKESNDFKKRIVSSVAGIQFPDNWDTLSEEEKVRRLQGVQDIALKTERRGQ